MGKILELFTLQHAYIMLSTHVASVIYFLEEASNIARWTHDVLVALDLHKNEVCVWQEGSQGYMPEDQQLIVLTRCLEKVLRGSVCFDKEYRYRSDRQGGLYLYSVWCRRV